MGKYVIRGLQAALTFRELPHETPPELVDCGASHSHRGQRSPPYHPQSTFLSEEREVS